MGGKAKQEERTVDQVIDAQARRIIELEKELERANRSLKSSRTGIQDLQAIRTNQERELMHVQSFLNSALISQLDQRVHEGVKSRSMNTGERLELVIGEYGRMQKAYKQYYDEALDLREKAHNQAKRLRNAEGMLADLYISIFAKNHDPMIRFSETLPQLREYMHSNMLGTYNQIERENAESADD